MEPKFRAAGIALRDEASTVGDITLQELLSDEVSPLLVSVLRLAMTARAGRHRTDSQEVVTLRRTRRRQRPASSSHSMPPSFIGVPPSVTSTYLPLR